MLKSQFENHKDQLVALIGTDKFAEEIAALENMCHDEEK